MTTKLYTAAEARRIDIERGGDGKICLLTRDKKYRYFSETLLVWFNEDGKQNCHVSDQVEYVPFTPEPEQPWSDKSQSELRIEQLEKELAEYKDHYHEILSDHGELTRKFDELKEKQRRKCCLGEPPFTGQPVIFLDGNTSLFKGYYDTETRAWFMKHGDHHVELTDRQVEDFYWKYEADL